MAESSTDELDPAAKTVRVDARGGPDADAPLPERIGRYRVTGRVGAGAMGTVLAAVDDELGRTVAVKIVREDSVAARRRLKREARALAALSHPNVVTVFEAGETAGGVYLVMERVDGLTLRDWLAAEDRDTGSVLRTLLQAGRGLAAAHAVGLVHRDFKPANVIVGHDGRAFVIDFGLARVRAASDSESVGEPSESSEREVEDGEAAPLTTQSTLDESLGEAGSVTRTGTVLGSPAYMAPEQFRVAAVGPAADQFAFCVTLYEALYGERPFRADSLPDLQSAAIAGRVPPPPLRSDVSPHVHAALVRGLSALASARFESMTDLLDALEKPRRRRYRGVALAGLAVVAVVAAASGLREPPSDPVADGEAAPAASTPAPVELEAISAYRTADQLVQAAARLDALSAEAEEVRTAWAAEVGLECGHAHVLLLELDRAATCFERAYFAADKLALHRIAAAAALGMALDVGVEREMWRGHAAAQLERIETSEGSDATTLLARARLEWAAEGRFAAALFDDALAGAGDDAALVAAIEHRRGELLLVRRRFEEADRAVLRALAAYVTAYGPDDPRVATAEFTLGEAAILASHNDAGAEHLRRAAEIWGTNPGVRRRLAEVRRSLSIAMLRLGRMDEAAAEAEAQVELLGDIEPPPGALPIALTNLGIIYRRLGRSQEALRIHERARAVTEVLNGGRGPGMAQIEANIGSVYLDLKDLDAAQQHYGAALSILEQRAEGMRGYESVLTGLGLVAMERREYASAEAHFRRALELREETHTGSDIVGYSRFDLARAVRGLGREQEARAMARQARAEVEASQSGSAQSIAEIDAFLAASP